MSWKLLEDKTVDGEDLIRFTIDPEQQRLVQYVKLFASGQLTAGGTDRRCLIRFNGLSQGYRSYVLMDGDHHCGEWEHTGFYVGRNGWHMDASLSVEYTISLAKMPNVRIGHGMSTFALHAGNDILGHVCNGFVLSNDPIRTIDLGFSGGVFTGAGKLLVLAGSQ